VCELLLDRGANINAIKLDGSTALHLCAMKGMAAVARLLINRGIDKTIQNFQLLDALEIARRGNQLNVVAAIESAPAAR
jgi:Arf-GAP with coiled-coil, ANK repeat and PH domain-containing protein